jgi:hypothetical protein
MCVSICLVVYGLASFASLVPYHHWQQRYAPWILLIPPKIIVRKWEVFAVYTIQNWSFMFGLNEKPLEKL